MLIVNVGPTTRDTRNPFALWDSGLHQFHEAQCQFAIHQQVVVFTPYKFLTLLEIRL